MAPLTGVSRRLTAQQQDRLIRREWPFRTLLLGNDIALWRGRVFGLSQGYDVSILYVLRHFQDGFEYAHAWFPEVRVHSPRLCRRPEAPDDPIPHVYDETSDPILCLFEPAIGGWSPSQAIAATILPWTAEWLRFYEVWHATGVWRGGGRDHAPPGHEATVGRATVSATHRVQRAVGMATSRIILSTIEVRQNGPIARWQLADALRMPDFTYSGTPEPIAAHDFLRRAA